MQPPTNNRYTVDQAADILGITPGAVRNRISRSTLQSVREGGRVYVLLPADRPRDTQRNTTGLQSANDALISEMRGRIESLERQLEAEREANRENRHIIAALTNRIPQLEAPSEPRGAPESPAEASEGVERSATGVVEEGTGRLSWWRRMFGW